jgi:hypothetical protein
MFDSDARGERLPQPPVLVDEPPPVRAAPHDEAECLVRRYRLEEVVEGPGPHRLDGRLNRAVPRDHDDHDVGIELHGPRQDRHAVDPRHPEVGQDDVRPLALEQPEPVLSIDGGHARIAVLGEHLSPVRDDIRLVIDDQHPGFLTHCLDLTPSRSSPSSWMRRAPVPQTGFRYLRIP